MNPNIPSNPHRIKPPADLPPPKNDNVLAELVIGTGKLTVYRQGGAYLFHHRELMGETELRSCVLVDELTDLKGLSRAMSALHDRREKELDKLRPKEPETAQVTFLSGVAVPRKSEYYRNIEGYLDERRPRYPQKLSDLGMETKEGWIPKGGLEGCDDDEPKGWFQKTWKNLKRDLKIGA